MIYAPELVGIQKKIEKTEEKLSQLRAEEKETLRRTKFKCDAILEKGTLFEHVCNSEFEIKDLTFIEHYYYSNEAYSEGDRLQERDGTIECPHCKTSWRLDSGSWDYSKKDYQQSIHPLIKLKYLFKEIKQERR